LIISERLTDSMRHCELFESYEFFSVSIEPIKLFISRRVHSTVYFFAFRAHFALFSILFVDLIELALAFVIS